MFPPQRGRSLANTFSHSSRSFNWTIGVGTERSERGPKENLSWPLEHVYKTPSLQGPLGASTRLTRKNFTRVCIRSKSLRCSFLSLPTVNPIFSDRSFCPRNKKSFFFFSFPFHSVESFLFRELPYCLVLPEIFHPVYWKVGRFYTFPTIEIIRRISFVLSNELKKNTRFNEPAIGFSNFQNPFGYNWSLRCIVGTNEWKKKNKVIIQSGH